MTTQEITLDQNSDDGLYTQLLRGRYVTSVEGSVITLDDGTELYIYGNEGCGGCSSGWYWLEETFKQGTRKARIMSAYVAYGEDRTEDEPARSVYTIFVMVDGNPHQLPLATIRGDDGNGYYGTGFTLTATIQKPPTVTATVTSRDIINALADGQTPPAVPDIRNREDLLNAVVYTLQQTRGFDSPLRITGPEAQLFHKLGLYSVRRPWPLLCGRMVWLPPNTPPLVCRHGGRPIPRPARLIQRSGRLRGETTRLHRTSARLQGAYQDIRHRLRLERRHSHRQRSPSAGHRLPPLRSLRLPRQSHRLREHLHP